MRMTNKIMHNNSLYNINNNKVLQDKLSTQMSTGKKLTRPSDDPVVAIRALRLRSDVSQITQFYEKNAPDADSWLKVTADALNTTTEVINSLTEQANRGSNKDLGCDDLAIIVTQLRELKNEFYATGNVDSAGRYVFTGFRTDTTLTYTEDTNELFTITEKFSPSQVDSINYTDIGELGGVTRDNYDPVVNGVREDQNDVYNSDIYRLRLSYDHTTDGVPTVTQVTDPTTVPPTEADLFPGGITVVSSMEDPNPYEQMQALNRDKEDGVIFIPETGELLISDSMYQNTFHTMTEDTQIRVTYDKKTWKEGDARPQHYFACTGQIFETTVDPATGQQINQAIPVNYNFTKDETQNPPLEYISMEGEKQIIEYDVGYNQKIRINTTADEVFTLALDRDIDDMEKALAELKEINASREELKLMMDAAEEGDPGYEELRQSYEACEKAYTHVRENMQKMFEGLNTKVKENLNLTSVAITDNGTRSSRLDLVSNRLMSQKTTFETLQSTNEDVDITETTIKLTSMQYSYQSSLMATSKILQNSLMNYI